METSSMLSKWPTCCAFVMSLKKFKLTAFSYKIPSKSPALQAQNKRNVPFRSNVFLRNNGMFTRKSHLPLETAARFKVRILLKKCRLPLKSTTNFSRASRCKNKQYSVKKVPFFQVALLKRKGQCSFHPCKKVHNVASAARRHFFQMCGSFFQKTWLHNCNRKLRKRGSFWQVKHPYKKAQFKKSRNCPQGNILSREALFRDAILRALSFQELCIRL